MLGGSLRADDSLSHCVLSPPLLTSSLQSALQRLVDQQACLTTHLLHSAFPYLHVPSTTRRLYFAAFTFEQNVFLTGLQQT